MAEVSRALSYPLSSTSVLLRSLAAMGYLTFDRGARTYRPSLRVPLLGEWMNLEGLATLLDELSRATQQLVVLARRSGLFVQYIHMATAPFAPHPRLAPGSLRSIAASAPGHVFLSHLPPLELQRLIRRLNAERAGGEAAIDASALARQVEMVRERGYAIGRGELAPGYAVLASTTTVGESSDPVIVGVGGPTNLISAKERLLAKVLADKTSAFIAWSQHTLAPLAIKPRG